VPEPLVIEPDEPDVDGLAEPLTLEPDDVPALPVVPEPEPVVPEVEGEVVPLLIELEVPLLLDPEPVAGDAAGDPLSWIPATCIAC
jgi:hypothetical protein